MSLSSTSSYPTSTDTFPDPSSTTQMDESGYEHDLLHQLEGDAIEALQAKVGVDSSAVTTSHDYKLSGVTGTDKAGSLTGTETFTNKTLTLPIIAQISNTGTLTLPTSTDTLVGKATIDTLTNKTLTNPNINEAVALTSTSTELNVLDGITSNTAELNILDGATVNVTELNYLDGTTLGTVVASKVLGVDASKDLAGFGNLNFDNNKAITMDESGGTARNVVAVNGSNVLTIGTNDQLDHTVINAGSSKLVKIKVLRQDDTTDTYTENSVILTGWGHVLGDGSNPYTNEAVSFGITFSEIPIIVTSCGGSKNNSNPSDQGDTDNSGRKNIGTSNDDATTGFTAWVQDSDAAALGGTRRFIYKWIAIGKLT